MNRTSITIYVIAGMFLIAVSCSHSVTADDGGGAGYLSLFNGQNLDGWVIENNARFAVRDGLLTVNKGTGWLRSEKEYGDFVFTLDFRFLEERANSGIFVRTGPTSKDDENGWPDNGYQVQCMDTITGERPCATMIPYGAPPFESKSDLEALSKFYRPTGQWNSYEITCVGEQLRVKLNSGLITTATNIKKLRGHLGIQAEHGRVEFRNLRIKLIEDAPTKKVKDSAQ